MHAFYIHTAGGKRPINDGTWGVTAPPIAVKTPPRGGLVLRYAEDTGLTHEACMTMWMGGVVTDSGIRRPNAY